MSSLSAVAAARAAVLWLSLLVAGCTSTTQGEFTAMACNDKKDNDGDDAYDCDDPDCEVWSWCAPGADAGHDAGDVHDAGHDAGDAGHDAGNGIGDACPPGGCDAGPPRGTYRLRPVEATVPPFYAEKLLCYDFCSVVPEVDCRCLPDPYVELWLRDRMLARSSRVDDTLTATWSGDDGAAEVVIGPEDDGELLVIAFDADPSDMPGYYPDDIPEQDDELLRCRPSLDTLDTGRLACRVPGTSLGVALEAQPVVSQ